MKVFPSQFYSWHTANWAERLYRIAPEESGSAQFCSFRIKLFRLAYDPNHYRIRLLILNIISVLIPCYRLTETDLRLLHFSKEIRNSSLKDNFAVNRQLRIFQRR